MTGIEWLKAQPIAHRGYHDGNKSVFENTMAAFSRAMEAGFAIECDVQLSSDSIPVIFHDHELERLCGIKGDIRERTAGELGLLSVGQTAEKIPSLKAMLRQVAGKVPVILEIKGRPSPGEDDGFTEAVLEVLEDYQGQLALMSFDHHILRDLKRAGSPYPLGLTASGLQPEEFFRHDEAMHIGLDFISYQWQHLPNSFVAAQRQSGIPVLTWTVRDEEGRDRTSLHADQMTFEGFDPREAL